MDRTFLLAKDLFTPEERRFAKQFRLIEHRLCQLDTACGWFMGIILGGAVISVLIGHLFLDPLAAGNLGVFGIVASIFLGAGVAGPLSRWRSRTQRAVLLEQARQLAANPLLQSIRAKQEVLAALERQAAPCYLPLDDEELGPVLSPAVQQAT